MGKERVVVVKSTPTEAQLGSGELHHEPHGKKSHVTLADAFSVVLHGKRRTGCAMDEGHSWSKVRPNLPLNL